MMNSEYNKQLQTFLRNITIPIYSELGWNDSIGNDVVKMFRTTIIEFICFNGYVECHEQSYRLFSQWKAGVKIVPNLLQIVLKYGIRHSDLRDDWDFLWDMYLNEQSMALRSTYLNALSFTTNNTLISLYV
jgi:hypothetical protein